MCITTYQPDTKSNPNPNPNPSHTTKQHAIVNVQLNVVTCPTYPEKLIRDMWFRRLCDFRLALSRFLFEFVINSLNRKPRLGRRNDFVSFHLPPTIRSARKWSAPVTPTRSSCRMKTVPQLVSPVSLPSTPPFDEFVASSDNVCRRSQRSFDLHAMKPSPSPSFPLSLLLPRDESMCSFLERKTPPSI